MKAQPDGLFWNSTDERFTKRKEILADHGWEQIAAGWWIETHLKDTVTDLRTIAKSIDDAYRIASNEKAEPPEAVWLNPDYLPYLAESKRFDVDVFTDAELEQCGFEGEELGEQHKLIFDIECYRNYFLIAFMSVTLKKVVFFEFDYNNPLNNAKLNWVFNHFCVIGFNSRTYDLPMCSLALANYGTDALKNANDSIISEGERWYNVLKKHKVKILKINHIDLIEPAPLTASLKIYGGRLHTKKMQDLPFHPDTILSSDQKIITRFYCINDLQNTLELYLKIKKELSLRESMSSQYALDLRSKSDAQLAESVLAQEIENLNRRHCEVPFIRTGTTYRYKAPMFIKYQTEQMNQTLRFIQSLSVVIGENGHVGLPETNNNKFGLTPDEISENNLNNETIAVKINGGVYRMGIGGLHSCETSTQHKADENTVLLEKDVTSYYPFIILNQKLYPNHLGPNFLTVYRDIVERRLTAKKENNKTVADSLKITINGSFGKFGSKYSILYSPDLLIQVTITGQLALLMLIESLELQGIPVVSANTDGVVIKCPKELVDLMETICKEWETQTQFNLESTFYNGLYSRDVNNYIAVKDYEMRATGGDINEWVKNKANQIVDIDKLVKTKGVFASASLSKNPQNEICIDAIKQFLINDVDIDHTIKTCTDFTKFLNVRNVKGGAVKTYEKGSDGLYLGKAVRWYYATDQVGKIVYATSGNKVPKSEGACPVMELPDTLPDNIDYDYYIKETRAMLTDIGVI